LVEATIRRYLGVEGDPDDRALTHADDPTVCKPREHLDVVIDRLDNWRPNEYRSDRLVTQAGDPEVFLEAVNLPTKRVAPNVGVERIQSFGDLTIDSLGENNQTGARAEDRKAPRDAFPYGGFEAQLPHQHAYCRALAARDDQAVQPVELLGTPDLNGLGAKIAERLDMLPEIALQGEDAYPHGLPATW